jgi:dihydroneopterin aldolase
MIKTKDLQLYCRKIFIRRLEVMVNIGIHDFEKSGAQRLWIDVDLYILFENANPKNDSLDEVVDYDFVRKVIANRIQKGHIGLQETLCDELAQTLLGHPGVHAVRLSTAKPDVYPDAEAVGVEVFFQRPEP